MRLTQIEDIVDTYDLPAPRVVIHWHNATDEQVKAILEQFPDLDWRPMRAANGLQWLNARSDKVELIIYDPASPEASHEPHRLEGFLDAL